MENKQIQKLTQKFISDVMALVQAQPAKKRMGMAALSPERRSEVARKAAATRKRRAAARKAADTRRLRKDAQSVHVFRPSFSSPSGWTYRESRSSS